MQTIKQKSVTVDLDGKSVEVRRMSWKPASEFLKKFATVAHEVYKDTNQEAAFGALVMQKLPEIVASSGELITVLCFGSTDFKRDEIDNLDVVSVLKITAEAMKVNFDDELKKCLAAVWAEASALIAAQAQTK